MGPYDKPFSPQEYLMHYGVKGMKWGVRRYQNKDGTLTKAGKERYSQNQQDGVDSFLNGIVLNTQSITAGLTAPAQYLVTDDGQIYGTNPMRSNLSPVDMKKL